MLFQAHLTRFPRLTLSLRGLKRYVSMLVPLMTIVFLAGVGARGAVVTGAVVVGVGFGVGAGVSAGDVVVGVVPG